MTRLLALALFTAAIYYLLTRQRPTPPEREAGELTPATVGHGTVQATVVLLPNLKYEVEAAG